MKIALHLIIFFILVRELYGSSLDLQDELSIRRHLEEVPDELFPHSLTFEDPRVSPYVAPQTVLNDRMFVSVEEYPDGYTGYHCSIIGNFRYTLELCSPHVWECIDGKLFKKTCPGSSVFWFSEEICVKSGDEPTCNYKGKLIRRPNWPVKLIQAARVKNDTEYSLMITTDCTKVQSGYFAIKECFPAFILCSDGVLRTQPCLVLGGMVFDERIKGCVSMEACKAPLEGKFRGIRFPTLPWDDKPKTREFREHLPEFVPFSITTDCRRKTFSSTAYEIGKCHQNFLICIDRVPVMHACPVGSVFSLRALSCIEKKVCEEKWDHWSQGLVPRSRNTSVAEQTREPLSLFPRPEEIVLVPTVGECVGKKNGRYAMKPCQAEYMRCFMDAGYKMECSEGFAFSGRLLECVGKEFCQE